MSKKLITACLGLVALGALALPAGASASPRLCETTPLPSIECHNVAGGSLITGTNVGEAALFSGETPVLECSKAIFTGVLTSNTGTHIEGDITTATFTGSGTQDPNSVKNMPECTGTSGLPNATVTSNGTHPAGTKVDNEDVTNGMPYCITANSDMFTIRGGTCTDQPRTMGFVIDFTGFGTCRYSRAVAITGTLTTQSTGDAIAILTPGESTEFSKVEGILCPAKFRLVMTITLETDEATAKPLYVS